MKREVFTFEWLEQAVYFGIFLKEKDLNEQGVGCEFC